MEKLTFGICTNCLKLTSYHTQEQRIKCLESIILKLVERLEDSEIIETKNEKETNYELKILETDLVFEWRMKL